MVERHGHDHATGGPVDDVGGVEAAAEADLDERDIGRVLGKQQEGHGGGDLEDGDRLAAIGLGDARHGSARTSSSTSRPPPRASRIALVPSGPDAARCGHGRCSPPPRAGRARRRRPSPCRWCRRYGSPAAAGPADCRAAPAAARCGRATGRSPSDGAPAGARFRGRRQWCHRGSVGPQRRRAAAAPRRAMHRFRHGRADSLA